MRIVILATLLAGCAVTASTCPSGTKLLGGRPPAGRAEWCSANDSLSALPATDRTFVGRVGQPAAMPGGVEGPYTSWYADGAMETHGTYANLGERSVPEGLWAFWYPSGKRWTMGNFKRGVATGCFAFWDESGSYTTGAVVNGELHVAACTPPDDEEIAIVEGRVRPAADHAAWGDLSIVGFLGPNDLGAKNVAQATQNPGMDLAIAGSVRARLGRLRVGPTLGVRFADNSRYSAYTGGATIGWELPAFHPRIDSEVAIDLAVERIDVTAVRTMRPGTAAVHFWSPLPAVRAGMAFALSPNLEAVATFHVDGVPATDVDREPRYCAVDCYAPEHETWQIGGIAYGVDLGLRLLVR